MGVYPINANKWIIMVKSSNYTVENNRTILLKNESDDPGQSPGSIPPREAWGSWKVDKIAFGHMIFFAITDIISIIGIIIIGRNYVGLWDNVNRNILEPGDEDEPFI